MRVATSLTIDRTSLELSPLQLTNDPTATYHYPEEGLAEPNFSMRMKYAPESAWIPGRLALGAVLDGSTLPLTVYVRGESIEDLIAKKVALSEAFAQLSYSVTLAAGGVQLGTYPADATTVWWGVLDHGLLLDRRAIGTVQIPVNPPTA